MGDLDDAIRRAEAHDAAAQSRRQADQAQRAAEQAALRSKAQPVIREFIELMQKHHVPSRVVVEEIIDRRTALFNKRKTYQTISYQIVGYGWPLADDDFYVPEIGAVATHSSKVGKSRTVWGFGKGSHGYSTRTRYKVSWHVRGSAASNRGYVPIVFHDWQRGIAAVEARYGTPDGVSKLAAVARKQLGK
ncbi:hypothetical protein [Nocardia heshunensis]